MTEKLWNKNFTTLTLGSIVTMLGHAVSSFAISLLVLDYTNSILLYSLYLVAYYVPMVIMPMLAGPWMDNFSRTKVIYSLDFLAAALYLGAYFLIRSGWFQYGPLLLGVLLIGSIDSVYTVAYESLYPNLITGNNYAKAYSVSSMLQPLAEVMTPIASLIYMKIGIAPLFLADAALFFIAACFETRITAPETYRDGKQARKDLRYMLDEMKQGIHYMAGEKGLLFITGYFFFCTMCGTGSRTLWLPYFKSVASLGVMTYTLVQSTMVIGRFLGGLAQYKIKYPARRKYTIAVTVYASICVLDGLALYTGRYVMMAMFFLSGLLAVTSYNIRLSTTQHYLPDTFRGRYNGCFQMFMNLGNIAGTLLAGALGTIFPVRGLVTIFMAVNFVGVFAIMLPGRRHVSKIYNQDV